MNFCVLNLEPLFGKSWLRLWVIIFRNTHLNNSIQQTQEGSLPKIHSSTYLQLFKVLQWANSCMDSWLNCPPCLIVYFLNQYHNNCSSGVWGQGVATKRQDFMFKKLKWSNGINWGCFVVNIWQKLNQWQISLVPFEDEH